MGLLTPLAIRIGRWPWLPRFLPQIVRVDLALQWLSRGRMTLLDVAGLPNLLLTVPGRTSGRLYRTPLLGVPFGGSVLIAGSNFGGAAEPAWVRNLEAAQAGTARMSGRTWSFAARLVGEDERSACWAAMVATWPNFALYQERTARRIKLFMLSPTGD